MYGVYTTGSRISNALTSSLNHIRGELDHTAPGKTLQILLITGGLQECDRNDGEYGIQHTGVSTMSCLTITTLQPLNWRLPSSCGRGSPRADLRLIQGLASGGSDKLTSPAPNPRLSPTSHLSSTARNDTSNPDFELDLGIKQSVHDIYRVKCASYKQVIQQMTPATWV